MFTTGAAPANQWMTIAIYLGAFVLLFYFMVVMPRKKQEKQHKELVESLSTRDRIVTVGGIVGEIKKVKEESIIIRTAESTELEIVKTAIGRRVE